MRIVVAGTSGSGKTTMARGLGVALGLPFVELDALNWQPGWRSLDSEDRAEFQRRVSEATAGDRWVSDGNYSAVRDDLWARATHLVWLDYERSVIMRRVIGRSIARAIDQRELWAGNREQWTSWLDADHPIRWAWSTWKQRRERYAALIAEPRNAHLRVLRLRRPAQAAGVAEWVSTSMHAGDGTVS
jgi:adenylate kinase family enzyme